MRPEQLDDLGKRPVEDVGVEFVESLGDVIFKYGDVERVLDGLGVILGKLAVLLVRPKACLASW